MLKVDEALILSQPFGETSDMVSSETEMVVFEIRSEPNPIGWLDIPVLPSKQQSITISCDSEQSREAAR